MAVLPRVRFGVIDDARRRQRRRWLLSGAGGIAAVIGLGFALARPTDHRPASPPRATRVVAPSKLLSREPSMGVACDVPGSPRCDRVGLAVWLKRPAVAVRAQIHGHHLTLKREHWASKRASPYTGIFRSFGLKRTYHVPAHWIGEPPVQPRVRLWIDQGRGPLLETHVRVWLRAGWG